MDFINLLKNLNGLDFLNILLDNGFDENNLKYALSQHLQKIVPNNLFGKLCAFEFHLKKWQEKQLKQDFIPTTPNESASSNPLQETNFRDILQKSAIGKALLSEYTTTKIITQKQRKLVSNLVTETNAGIVPTPKTFEKYSKEIVECFPTETAEVYYLHVKGKKTKGSLYYKYHNTISNLRRDGVLKKTSASKLKNNDLLTETADGCFDSKIYQADFNWLKYNIEPYEEAESKWISTYNKRLLDLKSNKNLVNILDDWPSYKQSFGHKLINLDFKSIFPGKENKLFEKWESASDILFKFMKIRVKDPNGLELLSKLATEECCSEVRSTVIVALLHSLLPPTGRKVRWSEGIMTYSKPTICDSRNTFIIRASTTSDLKCKIKELTDIYFIDKKTLQPLICVIGENFFNVSEYYVYFGNVFYKFDNVVKILDVCFKTFNVLNLEYPFESKSVWLFIKKFFFDMNFTNEEKVSSVYGLINDLDNFQLRND